MVHPFRLFRLSFLILLPLLFSYSSAPQAEPRVARGRQLFIRCMNCHTVEKNGKTRVGPNLFGIVGRKIASLPDFNYSPALKAEEGVWDREKLNHFLARPRHAVRGTNMTYRGILSPHDREDLIAWLASHSGTPAPSPDSDSFKNFLISGDAEKGRALFESCTACHTYTEGVNNKIGPNLHGVVGRSIGSAPGFSYSEWLIRRNDEIWTPERLNAFMFETKKFSQGSHAAFQKLIELTDRADIIAWLMAISPSYSSEELIAER